MQVSAAPHPKLDGFALVGARPEAETIVSATGAFAGRAGRVRLSGMDEVTKFPGEVSFDEFVVIKLDDPGR